MSEGSGTKEDPYTVNQEGTEGQYKFFKCGRCKTVAQCTPSNDFYAVADSDRPVCELCFYRQLHAQVSPERN
jgi:hypothetical protein